LGAISEDIRGELNTALHILWELKQQTPLLSVETALARVEMKIKDALELLTGQR